MKTDIKTGWEPERRSHFDEIVLNYDKARPEYPAELFADIIDFTGSGGKNALEIGAGTGKATKHVLNAGYNVTAVELGANMTEFLLEKFKGYENFNVITSAFEDAVLEENSYDLIYAASAFHWVNAEIGCPKVFRLLKSGGVFALMRYNFIAADDEELDGEIQTLFDKYYFSYYISKKRAVRQRRTYDDFIKPAEILNNYGFEDMNNYGFTDVSLKLYDFTSVFNADEYIEFINTMSDHRSLPEENRAALHSGIKEAIIKHGGYIKEENVFQLYMGRK